MKAQVPGPPTVTSSPILKVISPVSTQATSSLSRCRWNVVSVAEGAASSNSMTMSAVSPPTNLSAAERPGAMLNIDPPPGGTTKPFPLIAFSSSGEHPAERRRTDGLYFRAPDLARTAHSAAFPRLYGAKGLSAYAHL